MTSCGTKEVVCVLKALSEDGELSLSDGRTIVRPDSPAKHGNVVRMSPDFRLVVLANRPGYPFMGVFSLIQFARLISVYFLFLSFFPRASERRVLLIVGVCQPFSHLHVFTSHLLIFTSAHLHICSSSRLSHLLTFSSSHLLIFTSSHLHILSCLLALLPSCSLALSFFSISLLKARGSANETAQNEVRSPKTGVKLRFHNFRGNPFARNEVRSPKTAVKLRFCSVRDNPLARNEVRSPKTGVKLRFHNFRGNPFARNEVRSPKTGVKLRFHNFRGNPFPRNEVRSPKTAVKLRFCNARNEVRSPKTAVNGKIAILQCPRQPFSTK